MAGETTIDWGDGTPKQDGPAEGEVEHTYAEELDGKKQTITVCEKDSPEKCTEVTFTPGEEGDGGTPTPTPEPGGELKLTAEEDKNDTERMTVRVRVDNAGEGKVKLDFGDGSQTEEVDEKGRATHQYERAGRFEVTATDADDGKRKDAVDVTVPFGDGGEPTPTPEPEPEPSVEAAADEDDEKGRTAKLTWSGFPDGKVMISWGDRSVEEEGKGPKGSASHAYTEDADGEQTITVTGEKDSKATAKFTPKKPGGDKPEPVKLTVVQDEEDDKGMSVVATADNGGNPVVIDWGDKSEKAKNAGDGKEKSKHAYKSAADYTVTAEDAEDGSGDAAAKDTAEVTIPWDGGEETPTPTPTPEPEPKPSVEAAADEADESGRTVKATYDGFPKGKIAVKWGDKTKETEVDGPKGEASHEYGKDVKGEQTITLTSVEDDQVQESAKFTPKAPAARRYR